MTNDTARLELLELPSMLLSSFFVLEMTSQQIEGDGRWEMGGVGKGRDWKKFRDPLPPAPLSPAPCRCSLSPLKSQKPPPKTSSSCQDAPVPKPIRASSIQAPSYALATAIQDSRWTTELVKNFSCRLAWLQSLWAYGHT